VAVCEEETHFLLKTYVTETGLTNKNAPDSEPGAVSSMPLRRREVPVVLIDGDQQARGRPVKKVSRGSNTANCGTSRISHCRDFGRTWKQQHAAQPVQNAQIPSCGGIGNWWPRNGIIAIGGNGSAAHESAR
jgi:hypothetical protein